MSSKNEISHDYWKTIVETIQEGVMIVNTQGIIVSVNKALEEMTQYSKDELIGKSCLILDCDICEIVRKCGLENRSQDGVWCCLFRDGNVTMKRCTIGRKDGSKLSVKKNATLLYDSNNQVIGAVETLTDLSELEAKDNQIELYRKEMSEEDSFYGLIGKSHKMVKIFELIKNAAQSEAPVIIYGESGTGKELVAQAIHKLSQRRNNPFVKVDCAALVETLLESELFGHVKGAYTGAHVTRKGRFEAANKGDIFLDEIGDIQLSTQVKLLRVLEDKVIERVGSNTQVSVDVRIITATNSDLKQLMEQGDFRHDLYYRINVIPIHLPPLRKRKDDIPLLAESLFRKIKLKTQKPINGISKEAMQILINHNWPGNVREMRSVFEYAFVICHDSIIQPEHLLPTIWDKHKSAMPSVKTAPQRDEQKKEELIKALKEANGNQSEAAKILGVSRVTVWNRVNRYGIKIKKDEYELFSN